MCGGGLFSNSQDLQRGFRLVDESIYTDDGLDSLLHFGLETTSGGGDLGLEVAGFDSGHHATDRVDFFEDGFGFRF